MPQSSMLRNQQLQAAVAALSGASSAAVVRESDPVQLRQMFFYDAKATAIGLVKLLSCFNAASLSSDFRLPVNLESIIPAHPYSFSLIEGSSLVRQLSPATRAGMRGFRHYLTRVRDGVVQLMVDPGPGVPVSFAQMEGPIEVASTAACFAKLAVNDALVIARRENLEPEIAQLSYLIGLMDDVIGGKGPLWADGWFLEPRSDFTLRQRRVQLSAVAVVAREKREERVTVTNISVGGLGFDGAESFETGQAVLINLLGFQRTFSGTIIWRDGPHAGVRLSTPLAQDDPLLAGPDSDA